MTLISSHSRRQSFISKIILLICLTLTINLFSSCSIAEAHKCQIENVNRTYIQLWEEDSKRSLEDWTKQFSDLRNIGFSEVILQWTSYGWIDQPTPDYLYDPYFEIYLSNIIEAAKIQGIHLWIGLHHDPTWWDRLETDKMSVAKNYLDIRLSKLSPRIQQLTEIIKINDPESKVINGWYLSDEIDDLYWNSQKRFNLLTNYLSSIVSTVRQQGLDLPIMISAYSDANLSPIKLANFLTELTKQSDIDILLFQDGIGVEKLSLNQLKKYLPPLAFSLKKAGKSFGLIVELFKLPPNRDIDNLLASNYSRVIRQISIEKEWGTESITVFSAFEHLLSKDTPQADMLLNFWKQEYIKCASHEQDLISNKFLNNKI